MRTKEERQKYIKRELLDFEAEIHGKDYMRRPAILDRYAEAIDSLIERERIHQPVGELDALKIKLRVWKDIEALCLMAGPIQLKHASASVAMIEDAIASSPKPEINQSNDVPN